MDYQQELRYSVAKAGTLTGVLAFAALGAAVSTYFGLKSMISGSGAEGAVVPVVGAAVIGIGLFGVWHKLIKLIPMLHSPISRALGITLALAVTLVTVSVSSWFIATSIGGNRAVQAYMGDYVSEAHRRLGNAIQNFSAEQALVPTIQNFAAGWRTQAKNEANQGTISGRAGAGPVVATLNSAASDLETLAKNMLRTRDDVEGLREEAELLLAEMTKLASSTSAASPDIQARFSQTAGRYFQKLREIERLSMLPQAKLGGVVIVSTTTGGNVADNLKNIQVTLDKQTGELQRAIKKIEAEKRPIDAAPYAPTNPGTATWEYAGTVPGAWLVGIGVDLLPLIVLLLLMLTHAEARDPYVARAPFSVIEGGRELRTVA